MDFSSCRYQKMTDYTPQHFILSTHPPKFKDLDHSGSGNSRGGAAVEPNNYATMPVSYKAHVSNDSPDRFQTSKLKSLISEIFQFRAQIIKMRVTQPFRIFLQCLKGLTRAQAQPCITQQEEACPAAFLGRTRPQPWPRRR